MIRIIKVVAKDEESGTATEYCEYSKTDFYGPFIFFYRDIKKDNSCTVRFAKGMLYEDIKHLDSEDTKLNLVIKIIAEMKESFSEIYAKIFERSIRIVSCEEADIKRQIEEFILRNIDIQ